jgi:mannose-6-phosphate isomerase-like protein (cupin superfamily)
MTVPRQQWDKTCFADAKKYVEIYHVYASGTGFGLPEPDAVFFKGEQVTYEDESWAHAHPFEEMYLFLSADPNNTDDLGGEVEFWMGEGNDGDKFVLNKASCVVVPANTVHNPIVFRKVSKTIIMVVVADTDEYDVSIWTKPAKGFKAYPPDEEEEE